jgi:tetratricopeptide (TPR) repeat protein
MVRTVLRNPSWMSTFTMLTTIGEEHPESVLAIRARAQGLDAVGEYEEAAGYYLSALDLAPEGYGLLVEVAQFHGRGERWVEAEALLVRAIRLFPTQAIAWRLLSEQRLIQDRGREAHAVALEGLSIVGSDGDLWQLVSESYVAKGDYDAAIRARWASFGVADENSQDWRRMAELMELAGRSEEAGAALQHADVLASQESANSGGEAPDPERQR